MDREQLAWAAGLFDGEGSTGLHKIKTGGTARSCSLSVAQAYSPEVLGRFRDAVGVGTVYGPYQSSGRQKCGPIWYFKVSTFESVQAVIAKLWPWLSGVKRQQASRALMLGKGNPPKPTCAQGHLFTSENTYWTSRGTRVCKECRRRIQRVYIQRRVAA